MLKDSKRKWTLVRWPPAERLGYSIDLASNCLLYSLCPVLSGDQSFNINLLRVGFPYLN